MSATFVNQAFCEDCQLEGVEQQKQKPCKITREELVENPKGIFSGDGGKTCSICGHGIGSHPNQAVQTTIFAAQAKDQAGSQPQALAHNVFARKRSKNGSPNSDKSSSSVSSGGSDRKRRRKAPEPIWREKVNLHGAADENGASQKICDYWKSMWNAEIQNNVLDLGKDAKLLKDRDKFSKLSKMYIRDSDRAIVEEVLSGTYTRVAISGTPGVGKTMLRNLIVYEIVQHLRHSPQNSKIALSYSGDGDSDDMFVLETEGKNELYVSCWEPKKFKRFFRDTNQSAIYHLSDISKGDTRSLAECVDCCVAVRISSTNRGSYAEWLKQAEGNSIHLVSPVWSKDELDGWKKAANVDVEDYEDLITKFGGIPRVIFGDTPADRYEDHVRMAVGSMNLELVNQQITFGTTCTTDVRHKVVYSVRTCDHGDSCFKAECTSYKCGTLWIEDLIAKRLIKGKKSELSANLSGMWPERVDSTSKGIYMESVAHRLIMFGGDFNVKLLGGERQRSLPGGNYPLKLPVLDQWIFAHNQDDMAAKVVNLLHQGQDGYVRPTTSNFPAIDAVLVLGSTNPKKVLQLQMTVSNRHPINGKHNHGAIQNVLNAIASLAKAYLVFAIPNSRFNGFKQQKIGGNGSAKKIIQYSLDIESSLSQAGC